MADQPLISADDDTGIGYLQALDVDETPGEAADRFRAAALAEFDLHYTGPVTASGPHWWSAPDGDGHQRIVDGPAHGGVMRMWTIDISQAGSVYARPGAVTATFADTGAVAVSAVEPGADRGPLGCAGCGERIDAGQGVFASVDDPRRGWSTGAMVICGGCLAAALHPRNLAAVHAAANR